MRADAILISIPSFFGIKEVKGLEALPDTLTLEFSSQRLDSKDPSYMRRQFQITLTQEEFNNSGGVQVHHICLRPFQPYRCSTALGAN